MDTVVVSSEEHSGERLPGFVIRNIEVRLGTKTWVIASPAESLLFCCEL
jgi:hypothetical protein